MDCCNSIIEEFYSYLLKLNYYSDIEVEIRKINFDVSETHLKKAITIDCVNDKYIGRFTTWDDNSCVAEIIEVESEKDILLKRYDFDTLSQLKFYYQHFLSLF